jgi:hypothetical protein
MTEQLPQQVLVAGRAPRVVRQDAVEPGELAPQRRRGDEQQHDLADAIDAMLGAHDVERRHPAAERRARGVQRRGRLLERLVGLDHARGGEPGAAPDDAEHLGLERRAIVRREREPPAVPVLGDRAQRRGRREPAVVIEQRLVLLRRAPARRRAGREGGHRAIDRRANDRRGRGCVDQLARTPLRRLLGLDRRRRRCLGRAAEPAQPRRAIRRPRDAAELQRRQPGPRAAIAVGHGRRRGRGRGLRRCQRRERHRITPDAEHGLGARRLGQRGGQRRGRLDQRAAPGRLVLVEARAAHVGRVRQLRRGEQRGGGRQRRDPGAAIEREQRQRLPGARDDHARRGPREQRERVGAVEPVELDLAERRATLEVDEEHATVVATDASEQIALRVAADPRDRLGQLVDLGLRAVDLRDHVDARRVLQRGQPHHALGAAELGDRRRARQPQPLSRRALLRIPLLDRAGDRDHEQLRGHALGGRHRSARKLVWRQVRLARGQHGGAGRADYQRVGPERGAEPHRALDLDLGPRARPLDLDQVHGAVRRSARQHEQPRRRADPRDVGVLRRGRDADLGDHRRALQLDHDDAPGFEHGGVATIGRRDQPAVRACNVAGRLTGNPPHPVHVSVPARRSLAEPSRPCGRARPR